MAEKAITWYNRLKEAINGQIKQNGKREITGVKLNSVLNQMVDALGKNMTFGGVVSPATVIDNTDDNPVFYLALEAGNYPYCGNIVVGQGQIAFLFRDANNIWYQASWNASDENFTTEEKEKLQGLPTVEELREALGAKANAPESKPGSDNLASFDEDGNLKDSGVSIPVPTEEEKEHVLSSGETGLEWVPKPVDGDSALDIYNKLNPEAQLDEAGFISKLQQKYPMKHAAYYNEAVSKPIGIPFTGALDNDGLLPTLETMGNLYIMPNSNTNPNGSIAFTTINTGENQYKWVNLGAVDVPDNVLTKDNFDDTHLNNPDTESIAMAKDVAKLIDEIRKNIGGDYEILFDVEQGVINTNGGVDDDSDYRVRTVGYINEKEITVDPGTGYFLILGYDAQDGYIGYHHGWTEDKTNVTPSYITPENGKSIDDITKYRIIFAKAKQTGSSGIEITPEDFYELGASVTIHYDSQIKLKSGQAIEEVNIDNECNNGNQNDVASAHVVSVVKNSLGDYILNSVDCVTTEEHSYVDGTDGSIIVVTTSPNGYLYRADIEGADSVRFWGAVITNGSTGFAIYDENIECLMHKVYDTGSTQSAKEYEVELESLQGAKWLYWTVQITAYNIRSEAYAVKVFGKNIQKEISKLNDEVAEVNDEVEEVRDKFVKYNEQKINTSSSETGTKFEKNSGGEMPSTYITLLRFNGIDPTEKIKFKCNFTSTNYENTPLVGYYKDNGSTYIGCDYVLGSGINQIQYDELLQIPPDCDTIKINAFNDSFELIKLNPTGEVYDLGKISKSIDSLRDKNKTIKITVNNNDNGIFNVRSHYDDENDILISVGYSTYTFPEFLRNCLLPQKAYIGSNTLSDSELIAQGYNQRIDDCIGPITMDWCGPIFANHGYSTPAVSLVDSSDLNKFVEDDIWYDTIEIDDNTSPITRKYRVAHVPNNANDKIYLLPIIEYGENDADNNYPIRNWVSYQSQKISSLTKENDTSIVVDIKTVDENQRYDYQVCKCVNIKIYIDGTFVDSEGEYYGNEVMFSYEQICYDPVGIYDYISDHVSDKYSWWPNPVTAGILTDIQCIYDRQFVFTADKGFLSYTNSQKLRVVKPFKMGETCIDGKTKGHYIGTAPTAFLKKSPKSDYSSKIFIPKVKLAARFKTEEDANYTDDSLFQFYRDTQYLYDVNHMPERLYSYLYKTESNNTEMLWGVAGGHSLVRGLSVDSVRNENIDTVNVPFDDGIPEPTVNERLGWIGPWYPSATNKLYTNIMTKNGNSFIFGKDYIGVDEGYFCWYIPNLVDAASGAAVHTFYHKSNNDYIVYVHTKGSVSCAEVRLPQWMNGMEVVTPFIEEASDIESKPPMYLLDDIVVNGKLHVSVDATNDEECNYIVFKLK